MAVEGTQEGTMVAGDTRVGTTVVVGTPGGITMGPAITIIPVGTGDGDTGIILAAIGGDLGPMVTRGGPILIATHILTPITIPIATLTPITFPRRRPPKNLPCTVNRNRNNLTTGTTARIRRATIHTSRVVREVGHR